MEQVADGDPGRDKLITLWTDDSECPVRTLRRDKYRSFSRQKEHMVRQQHLDATVRDELHELS